MPAAVKDDVIMSIVIGFAKACPDNSATMYSEINRTGWKVSVPRVPTIICPKGSQPASYKLLTDYCKCFK